MTLKFDIEASLTGSGKLRSEIAKAVADGFKATGRGGLSSFGALNVTLDTMSRNIRRVADFMAKSSPLLGSIFDLFRSSMMLFFRPFGDFLGMLLRPVAIWLLRMAINFNNWFKDLPPVLKGLLTFLTAGAVVAGGAALAGGATGALAGGIGGAVGGTLGIIPKLLAGDLTAGAVGGLFASAFKTIGKFVGGALIIYGTFKLVEGVSELFKGSIKMGIADIMMGLGAIAGVFGFFGGGPIFWGIGISLYLLGNLLKYEPTLTKAFDTWKGTMTGPIKPLKDFTNVTIDLTGAINGNTVGIMQNVDVSSLSAIGYQQLKEKGSAYNFTLVDQKTKLVNTTLATNNLTLSSISAVNQLNNETTAVKNLTSAYDKLAKSKSGGSKSSSVTIPAGSGAQILDPYKNYKFDSKGNLVVSGSTKNVNSYA